MVCLRDCFLMLLINVCDIFLLFKSDAYYYLHFGDNKSDADINALPGIDDLPK